MRLFPILVLLLLPAVVGVAQEGAAEGRAGLAQRVVLLANASDPSSLLIARHYCDVRGVPRKNIIALPMSPAETITWHDFTTQIWEPLMARLVHEGWIDAIAMDLTDVVGRRKYAVHTHHIAALIVCRGVPLRVAHDPQLYTEVGSLTRHPEFRTNACSVDGELALLAAPNHPINAFVPNPLFQNSQPTAYDRQQVVEVSRLDGPTEKDAMALVDLAVAAERTGLLGRAYVDLSDRDPIGNRWLESTARQLDEMGFPTDVDHGPNLMPLDARIDAPVLYFGWYAANVGGAFLLPGFRFPPGAIALHIHSYSATTLRSATSGWAGPFVARGVTATVGNVYEPYLQLTHRPDIFFRALSRGATLADAAFFALPALSWQAVLIGDPLYRPFAVSLAQQVAESTHLPPEFAGYAAIRRARRLEQENHAAAARDVLATVQRLHPTLAVGYALAERELREGHADAAVAALSGLPAGAGLTSTDWALARAAATLLSKAGHPAAALPLWRALLAADAPVALRQSWYQEAIAAARSAHNAPLAAKWESETP